jgi:hypothetical protein
MSGHGVLAKLSGSIDCSRRDRAGAGDLKAKDADLTNDNQVLTPFIYARN